MRTQSIDTNPEVERILITLLRQKGVSRRFQLVASMSQTILLNASLACQTLHSGMTEQEAMFSSVERLLGKTLTAELRQVSEQRQIAPSFATINLLSAFLPVLNVLESVSITCALSGSLARSIYGMQRALTQVDVLADLTNVDATLLYELLPATFYMRLADTEAALASQTSFVIYHLPSLFTLQIAFPRKHLDEKAMLMRAHHLELVGDTPAVPILAPEDVSVLALKEVQQAEAELMQKGSREEPDDLWNELLGVLKVQAPELDQLWIEQQACRLGLSAWAHRAFEDAGW